MVRRDLLAWLTAAVLLPALTAPMIAVPAQALVPAPATSSQGEPAAPWPQAESLFAGPAWAAIPRPTAGPLPSGPSADLAPTGLVLAGGSRISGLVVDGTGAVWVDGPWQVARFDPVTATSQVWDASDDLSFGRVHRLVGSASVGVWLVESDRVRMFDGRRFVVDLAVPPEYRGAADITSMAQVGSEVWVGSRAGVARWDGERWSMIGLGQVADVTVMAVDSAGTVWVAAEHRAGAVRRAGLAWFDGQQWVVPPSDPAAPTATIREIVADPTGGVVVRAFSWVTRIARFDGGRWAELTDGLFGAELGDLPDQAMAITHHGDLWVTGQDGVVVLSPHGTWRSVVDAGGVPGTPRKRGIAGVALAGTEVVVADRAGLLAVEGDRLVRAWRDPAGARLAGALDELPTRAALVARSADDVWVQPYSWYTTPTAQVVSGSWAEIEPPSDHWWNGALGGALVRASDGAIWAISSAGLARFESATWQVVAPEYLPALDLSDATPRLAAGADGAVWVVPQADAPGPRRPTLVEITPEGGRTSLRVPVDPRTSQLVGFAGGTDGAVWALVRVAGGPGVGDAGPTLRVLRWDGGWRELPAPPLTGAGVADSAVTGDGALWVSGVGPEQQDRVARLSDDGWMVFDVPMADMWALGDRVCGVPDPWTAGMFRDGRPTPIEVACVGSSGPAGTLRLDLPVVALGVAPDGATWVLGEQLARLPGAVG